MKVATCTCEYAPGQMYEVDPAHAAGHAVTCPHSNTKVEESPFDKVEREQAEREREVLYQVAGIRQALETLVLHAGLISSALEDLSAQGARFFMTRARKTKRKPKRKRRKPRGLAASLVSLVLLVGCGGIATPERVELPPVLSAEGGVVRVEQRDAGVDRDAIECTPDAERTTGVLCEHPKRRRDAH